jgi:hypothetical protein
LLEGIIVNLKKIGALCVVLISVIIVKKSYACSSCGSSATSPLVLNLNENLKMYFGLSQNSNYMNYGGKDVSDTTRTVNRMLSARKVLTLAVGYRTSENSFLTLTGSFLQNEGATDPMKPSAGTKVKYLYGDPVLSGRYNLVNMGMDNTYRPQIQLIGSYKPSIAKNMVDKDGGAVDTVGNGFHQIIGGVDFWWGMPFIQFGASQLVTYSFDRKPDNDWGNGKIQEKRTRDLQYTTIVTVGHVFKELKFSIQGGVILDYIGDENSYIKDVSTGNTTIISRSPSQSNSVFALAKFNLTSKDTLRFSYTLGGAYDGNIGPFTNSNQTTSDTALVAYERTFF